MISNKINTITYNNLPVFNIISYFICTSHLRKTDSSNYKNYYSWHIFDKLLSFAFILMPVSIPCTKNKLKFIAISTESRYNIFSYVSKLYSGIVHVCVLNINVMKCTILIGCTYFYNYLES